MSGLQFQPELVRKIARGEKTQTRRLAKHDRPPRWRVGHTYAVQPGRGKPAQLRIKLLELRTEPVGHITLEDARAEGFRTTAEFACAWVRIHDKPYVQANGGDDADPNQLARRFTERHAHRPVHVLTFTVDNTHHPRYLAAGWHQSSGDYTSQRYLAVAGEPETVTEHDQEQITAQAGRTFEHWRALEEGHREQLRRLVAIDERLAAAAREARRRGVDISREVWLVNRLRQQGRTDTAVLHRVRGVERKIDRYAA